MLPKVKETLNRILERFERGEIPEAISIVCFPQIDIPMKNWSLLNRLLVYFSGTLDARGIKQWNKIGRFPVKGSKAIYILAPTIEKEEDEEGHKKRILKGFVTVPVFRYEDTVGKDICYPELKLPDYPLMERAKEWGISVKATSGNEKFYGCYSQNWQEIVLATEAECVFFHELSHAAHARIIRKLKGGQDPLQEIVSELSGLTLCKLVGRDPKDYFGNSYRYISRYAEKLDMNPYAACIKVITDVEKILNIILGIKE